MSGGMLNAVNSSPCPVTKKYGHSCDGFCAMSRTILTNQLSRQCLQAKFWNVSTLLYPALRTVLDHSLTLLYRPR
jgi:hypothetical protein